MPIDKSIDYSAITPEIKALTKLCLADNVIEPEMYVKYAVNRGLRDLNGNGVLTGLTEISEIQSSKMVDGEKVPCEGKLFYRGVDVEQIVSGFIREKRYGFEETAYLLLFGELPTREQLNDFAHVYSQVYAKVISEPALSSSGKSVGMTVRVEYISGDGKTLENPKSKFKVYLPSGSNVRYGMGISFKAELGRPEEKLGDFYYRRQLLSQGCYMSVYANSFSEYRPKETMWDKFCGVGIMIRGKVSEYADYILAGSEESGLLKGILIGDKNDFSENLYSDMSKSGFMHIAAVSGLHVSFLCALLGVLLSAFSKKIRIAVTVPVLILFASVAAFTPSVNRAVIMMSIFLFSYLLMKDPDPVTSLFTAALVLVAVNPYVVFNLSFILSFSATLSLLIFARPLTAISKAGAEKASEKIFELTLFKRFVKNTKVLKNNIVKSISWLLDAFLVPLACQIGVMPILAYYFERISIGSIVGNIIVIPSTMIVFVVGFINFLIYCIYPPLSGLLSLIIIRPFLRLIRGTAGQLSGLSYVPGLKMSLFSIIVYYILAAAFYYFLTFVLKKIKSATKNAEKL